MRATKARGVHLRRARVISEPITTYIRYEHWGTPLNILAGEEVRWLPRTKAARLALPGTDFWLFDQQRVLFNHFTGDGGWIGNELVTDEPATPPSAHRPSNPYGDWPSRTTSISLPSPWPKASSRRGKLWPAGSET